MFLPPSLNSIHVPFSVTPPCTSPPLGQDLQQLRETLRNDLQQLLDQQTRSLERLVKARSTSQGRRADQGNARCGAG